MTKKPPTPAQRERLERLARQLDAVEAELRRLGYWIADPPDLRARYESGELQTYLDAPTFELWLQQVFLPNARESVEDADLPEESQVGLMARRHYDYHSHVPEAQRLLELLDEFDDLVEGYAR
jgi:uncharacterized protein YqcC (DUF446 family)